MSYFQYISPFLQVQPGVYLLGGIKDRPLRVVTKWDWLEPDVITGKGNERLVLACGWFSLVRWGRISSCPILSSALSEWIGRKWRRLRRSLYPEGGLNNIWPFTLFKHNCPWAVVVNNPSRFSYSKCPQNCSTVTTIKICPSSFFWYCFFTWDHVRVD